MNILIIIILAIIVVFFLGCICILKEYERGVIFTLGRYSKVSGPGLILVIPVIQQITRVQLRTVVMDIPSQDVISRDNVSVEVNGFPFFVF